MADQAHPLTFGFLRSVEGFGGRPALEVAGQTVTYADLFERAASLAATLDRFQVEANPPFTAVFAYRSVTAFVGVLAALLRGHGYVPLNRTFPNERSRSMLQRSESRALVVDAGSEAQLPEVLEGIDDELLIIFPERQETQDLIDRWPKHQILGARDLISHQHWQAPEVSPDAIAYLLFTSGSTGNPKGVMVTHRNVRSYVDFVAERFQISQEDRFSQTFDLTFDLSVADMFVAWERGACLCCPSEKMLINPGRFIRDSGLTVWFSVPSTAVFMKRLGALKPKAYPNLRLSMFCGEALPVEVVKAWAEAAPHSVIENAYGPTELTIACTYYRWDPERSLSEAEHGVVPIGAAFPGMTSLVVDESLQEVQPGEEGELLMTGPQLSLGYWRDPAKTEVAFVRPLGRSEVYYRTGDRVRKPEGDAPLIYLGRVDNQIKILGHRVELSEVEGAVREESGVDGVVALGWPKTLGGAGGVEVFLQTEGPTPPDLREKVGKRLPVYMAPRKYHCIPTFPLNTNGKYDRIALTQYLEKIV